MTDLNLRKQELESEPVQGEKTESPDKTPTLDEKIKELEQEAVAIEFKIQNPCLDTTVDEMERLFTCQKAVSVMLEKFRTRKAAEEARLQQEKRWAKEREESEAEAAYYEALKQRNEHDDYLSRCFSQSPNSFWSIRCFKAEFIDLILGDVQPQPGKEPRKPQPQSGVWDFGDIKMGVYLYRQNTQYLPHVMMRISHHRFNDEHPLIQVFSDTLHCPRCTRTFKKLYLRKADLFQKQKPSFSCWDCSGANKVYGEVLTTAGDVRLNESFTILKPPQITRKPFVGTYLRDCGL